MRPSLLLLSISLLLASCAPPRVTPLELNERYQATQHQTINQLYYMGSKGSDHYFHHARISIRKVEYRVSRDDLSVHDEFPLTDNPNQWRQYLITEVDAVGTGGILLTPYKKIPLGIGEGPFIEGIRIIEN